MFSKRFHALSSAVASCLYSKGEKSVEEEEAFYCALDLLHTIKVGGGTVFVLGNGGSAGIASHFSTDLMKSLRIPSQTLYDSNLMTCISNDLGYENVFCFPLEQLLRSEDLVVAISSSGRSPNILKGAATAHSKGARLMTFSGFHRDNPLRTMGHLNFWIDRSDYGLVETAHFFLLHTLIDLWSSHVHLRERDNVLCHTP